MTPERRAQIEAACKAIGIDPMTLALGEIVSSSPKTDTISPFDSLRTKRILFVPLNDDEARIVEDFLPAGSMMKYSMREIVNDLLAVALGASWNHVANGQAARMRLQRGVARGDFTRLHEEVGRRPDVFSPERVESFRRLAVMEAKIADRRC